MLAALVCPLCIGATTAPQDPSAWASCRACWQPAPPHQMWAQLAKGASPPLPAEMHGWANQTRSVSPSPLADIPHKPKKQAQSSFAEVKNNLPWGRESPERSLLQTRRLWEDTHPGTANAHRLFHPPAPLRYCSTAINHGEAWNSGLFPPGGSLGCRNRAAAGLCLLIPPASAALSPALPRIPSEHRVQSAAAVLPLRSLPPALDYSIRDYAFASYLQANWGLCQGQHKFQPVSLITARPAHWKL